MGKLSLDTFWDTLIEHSCGTLLQDTVVGDSCGRRDTLVGNSCEGRDNRRGYSSRTFCCHHIAPKTRMAQGHHGRNLAAPRTASEPRSPKPPHHIRATFAPRNPNEHFARDFLQKSRVMPPFKMSIKCNGSFCQGESQSRKLGSTPNTMAKRHSLPPNVSKRHSLTNRHETSISIMHKVLHLCGKKLYCITSSCLQENLHHTTCLI